MAQKRMNTYIVNVRWKLPDGSSITRQIAENGLTAASAKRKVMAHYRGQSKKLGKATAISVTRR
jgi:hypothetical protein